jgi:phospholipase C
MKQNGRVRFFASVGALALAAFLVGCRGLTTASGSNQGIKSINHIIFMAQENRGFDHYFGKLNDYRKANGLSTDVDGLPANATNPSFDGRGKVAAFHLQTMCVENPSPSWNESHFDWNRFDPTSGTATMDGFVFTAGHTAQTNVPVMHDIAGVRVMGYYDASDLPYYYFMASNFATSDRWFSPVMSRTQPNRMYLVAATSAGHAYPLTQGEQPLPNKTIFQMLEEHGISWKVYMTDFPPLAGESTTSMFSFFAQHQDKIVPISQYFTDVAKGQLPQVAMIDPGFTSGRDEHPAIDPNLPQGSVQVGANYVASVINALMGSISWNDSVFILTHDEGGGFYDHVPPHAAVSPDGIPPSDLLPGDVCLGTGGANCDFNHTGFRVPLIVVSPFTKPNYVSHTPMDYTAILKLIETRFSLPSLTKRDAAQPDMTEFFDFANAPLTIPPFPPDQPTNGPCYLDRLP